MVRMLSHLHGHEVDHFIGQLCARLQKQFQYMACVEMTVGYEDGRCLVPEAYICFPVVDGQVHESALGRPRQRALGRRLRFWTLVYASTPRESSNDGGDNMNPPQSGLQMPITPPGVSTR